MKIETRLGDKGLYITDCVDQEHLDKIFELESTLRPIEQSHFFRTSFNLSDNELNTYLIKNINSAILEYLTDSNKDRSEYIARNSYAMSHWMLNKRLNPHIDTIKYDHEDTHTPRSIINALLYLTDDYDGATVKYSAKNL
jgi:hypothetical protein